MLEDKGLGKAPDSVADAIASDVLKEFEEQLTKRLGMDGLLLVPDEEGKAAPLGALMDEAIEILEAVELPSPEEVSLSALAEEGVPSIYEGQTEEQIILEYVEELLGTLRPSLIDMSTKLSQANKLPEGYKARVDVARKMKRYQGSIKAAVKSPSTDEEHAEFPTLKAEQDLEATVALTCRYKQPGTSADQETSPEPFYNDVEKHPVPAEQPKSAQTDMPHIYC